MEIKAKHIIFWFVLLIIGIPTIAGPVGAYNLTAKPHSQTIKIMDSKVPIATKVTNEDKDKKVKDSDNCKKDKKLCKDKKDNSGPIKIKSHPVLKSPIGSSAISTTVYASSSTQYNLTVRRPQLLR